MLRVCEVHEFAGPRGRQGTNYILYKRRPFNYWQARLRKAPRAGFLNRKAGSLRHSGAKENPEFPKNGLDWTMWYFKCIYFLILELFNNLP